MTPTNSIPGTASRGPRRVLPLLALSGLIAASLAAPAPAPAQGVIEFSVYIGSPWPVYEARADGTGFFSQVPIPQTVSTRTFSTARSDYPGGRQYHYARYDGQGGKG